MVNIITSVLIWGLTALLVVSILVTGGMPLPAGIKQKFSFFDKKSMLDKIKYRPEKKEYIGIIGFSLLVRIIMIVFAVIAICMFMDTPNLSVEDFLNKFVIWDANSYVNIAKGGYTQYLENGEPITLVFFPLYSMIIKVFSIVISDYRIAGLVVSALCFSVGNCFLYAFASKCYGKNIAQKTILYLTISAFGFFFGTLMSESVFFMMICICLYLIDENKWLLFAIAGILCALARMQGVLIIIPACIHWFETYKPIEKIRKKDWKSFGRDIYTKLIFVPLPILGTLIYFFINYKVTGNAFMFMDYQKRYWSNGFAYIGKAMETNLKNAFGTGLTMTTVSMFVPQIVFFALAIGLCIYGLFYFDNKIVSYLLAYTFVCYSLAWLISGSRYMVTAVPMWIMLAAVGQRFKWVDKAVVVLSPVLMGVYYVGYLFMKQIM